ncbi:coenzyme F420-0:L-glutamate ligase [Streptomyces sp. NPDC051286]|uniref:coenzyme F420-0:L-glutamate ligase n=1 Tax=Streptomyces sp. NPDC051286 TaxID=3365647 RepID=UPI00378A49EA
MTTSAFSAFSVEPFPRISPGDDLGSVITTALDAQDISLCEGDVIVVASKVVSISEERRVDLAAVTPGDLALGLSARTGKPAEVVQVVLDESDEHFVAGERGPIIARHRLGYQLTSAGVDRDGLDGVWLLPADPDASARGLRDAIAAAAGAQVAVVIADSDGRADRLGSTVLAIGAAGIAPLRDTEHAEPGGRTKRQEETLVDLVAAAAGVILGQRGRGAPVVSVRGVEYESSDEGVRSVLHHGGHSAEAPADLRLRSRFRKAVEARGRGPRGARASRAPHGAGDSPA